MTCKQRNDMPTEVKLYQENLHKSLDRGDYAKSAILLSKLSKHRPVFDEGLCIFYDEVERELTVKKVLEIEDEC